MNPLDKNPLSKQNIRNKQQYIYGGVDVTGEKLSVVIVFRVVSTTARYHISGDTISVTNVTQNNQIVHGMLGLDLAKFRETLSKLYHKVIF